MDEIFGLDLKVASPMLREIQGWYGFYTGPCHILDERMLSDEAEKSIIG